MLKGEDLKGKTIGVLSFGGGTETFVDILARSGVRKSEVRIEVAGNSPGEVELIRRGRIDCFVCTFAVQRAGEPIYERASKDFEIPQIKDLDMLAAYEQTAIDKLWLAQGRKNLRRNMPPLWQAGVGSLRDAGFVDIKDATPLYTNHFIDQL